MKLYMVPLAPNPTKVMLYIAERQRHGLDMGIEQIVVNTVKGRHREPEHLARNPFGKLPVLELEEGTFLLESLAIIHYLENRFPDGALLPRDPLTLAQALEIARIVELGAAINMGRYAHATNSPLGRPADPEAAAEAEAGAQPALDYLEDQLGDGREFLTGGVLSIADFTLQAACQFLRFVEADMFGDRPRLRQWDERVRTSQAGQAVLKW